MDPAEAARALEEAADREQIFAVLLRAARSRVQFAALLSVHRDGFRGRRALAGDRFDGSSVGELQIPRNVVPAFEQAVSTRAFYLGPIATGVRTVDDQLQRLGGVLPQVALVLPVVLQERTVALIVGHSGERPLAVGDVSDLFPLVSETGRLLQRMLASRAQAAAEKPSPPGSTTAGVDAVVVAPEDIDDVEALSPDEQRALARRVLIREMGVMTIGALLITTLLLRAATT